MQKTCGGFVQGQGLSAHSAGRGHLSEIRLEETALPKKKVWLIKHGRCIQLSFLKEHSESRDNRDEMSLLLGCRKESISKTESQELISHSLTGTLSKRKRNCRMGEEKKEERHFNFVKESTHIFLFIVFKWKDCYSESIVFVYSYHIKREGICYWSISWKLTNTLMNW